MHIQNPAIFRILVYLRSKIYSELWQDIFWHIQNTVQRSHIENPAIFRTFPYPDRSLAYLRPNVYSESCLLRLIQAYSGIFNNDSYNNINFRFFTLILHFLTKFEKTCFFDYNDVNFNADWVYLNNTRSLKIAL